MRKQLKKTIAKHLKEDIKGYSKQRKHLKKEMKEDEELIKKVKKPQRERLMAKKAAPKKRSKRVTIGKGMTIKRGEEKKLEKKPGGSNVGEYKKVSKTDFAGPKGGAPKGSYPINTLKRARAALAYAHNAPDPAGIRRAVYKKYPELKKNNKK